jgi:hypothetical protein
MLSFLTWRRAMRVLAACLVLAGCTARDGALDDPLRRNFQWFSFVGGDDIRARCGPAAPARYRFVYNAVWEEQVRVYDVVRLPRGQGAELSVTVIRGAPRLLQSYLLDSAAVGTRRAQARLGESEVAALADALAAAGFDRAPADGTRLQSYDFYWLVNACVDGRWQLNAWRRQDPGFDRLGFDRLLLAQDRTGVPVNPVRPVDPAQRLIRSGDAPSERGRAANDSFELMIRGGRLYGHAGLF